MEIFWYQLTQVHLEKWPLKWREREPNSHYIYPNMEQMSVQSVVRWICYFLSNFGMTSHFLWKV